MLRPRSLRPAALALVLALAFAAGCGSVRERAAAPAAIPPPATPVPARAETTATPVDLSLEPPPQGSPVPAAPAPATGRPRAGYDGKAGSVRGLDTTPLRGRRIVLDPGHGGRFPGSIGVRGLSEAEVNLGVSLHLWGMLFDAGAEVHLTRTSETDFEAGADSTLRTDLQLRTERANAFRPEVFLSIHHNADPGRRNNVNEIQTYYRFDDEGASRELAESIHRRLKRNLRIQADRVLPGNFYVIRNSTAPAVLGEASYLTNPDVEAQLAQGAKQRLEAEGYFLGLLDYFTRGVPRIAATRLEPPAGGSADDARERPWFVLEADRALDAAQLLVDGVPADTAAIAFAAAPGGRTLARWRPDGPLTDGRHTLDWVVRAKGGGWSRTVRETIDVDLPVARVALEANPPRELATGQVVALTLRALDRHGRPVADTLHASFTSRVGAVLVDSLARRPAAGTGTARAYARVTGGALAAFTARIAPGSGVPAEMATQELTLPLVAPGAAAGWRTGFARGTDGAPVGGALVAFDTLRATTNGDGYFALRAAPGFADSAVVMRAAGYVAGGEAYRLAAIGGGALLGKRIAIDPGGGGADTSGLDLAREFVGAGAAPLSAPADTTIALVLDDSLRVDPAFAAGDSPARRRAQVIEADANLRVARALREYLEAAGASVVLTRDAPESLTSVGRLRRTEAFRPDRVLVLSHRAPAGAAGAGHYFSSSGGKALAGRIASRLRTRGVAARAPVSESASYVVAQTAAVAASVNLPNAAPTYVDPTRGAGRLREEAYAIYLALLEDLGSDPKTWQGITCVASHGAAPEPGVPVTLDGRWTLFTDAKGRVRFDGLPSGARLTLAADGTRASASATTPARGDIALDLGPAPAPRP